MNDASNRVEWSSFLKPLMARTLRTLRAGAGGQVSVRMTGVIDLVFFFSEGT